VRDALACATVVFDRSTPQFSDSGITAVQTAVWPLRAMTLSSDVRVLGVGTAHPFAPSAVALLQLLQSLASSSATRGP
jgi:hypothetical protein